MCCARAGLCTYVLSVLRNALEGGVALDVFVEGVVAAVEEVAALGRVVEGHELAIQVGVSLRIDVEVTHYLTHTHTQR